MPVYPHASCWLSPSGKPPPLALLYPQSIPPFSVIINRYCVALISSLGVAADFNWKKSALESQFSGKTGKAKISWWWTMGGLYQTVFPQAFFPSNVTGFLESSVSSVCTCRELMGPLGPPQWKEGSCEHWDVRLERWVDLCERMWGLYPGTAAWKVHWVLILFSRSKPMQHCFGEDFKAVVLPLMLSSSRVSGTGWQCCHTAVHATACSGARNQLKNYPRSCVVVMWGALAILQMVITLCRPTEFAPSGIILAYWYPWLPLPCFRTPLSILNISCKKSLLSAACDCCPYKSCTEMEVIQKLDKIRILLMEIGQSCWNEVAEGWLVLLAHLGNSWYSE